MHSAADDFFLDNLYFRTVPVALEIFGEVPEDCLERAELPDEPLVGGRFGDESSAFLTQPLFLSSKSVRRAVVLLTPNFAMSSFSEGILSPADSFPDSIRPVIQLYSSAYLGVRAADLRALLKRAILVLIFQIILKIPLIVIKKNRQRWQFFFALT